MHYFVRNKKSYFIIFYEIDDFKLDSTTFNRKVVLVTSNNVITIGYYYYSITSKTNLFLKCNNIEKSFCKTEIKYDVFISCIWAAKSVNFNGLLMKFKAPDSEYNQYKEKDHESLCFNLINKNVCYVDNRKITKEDFPTLDKFGTISERTTLME